jgi:tetratricopeptide (TPR) repeat protein
MEGPVSGDDLDSLLGNAENEMRSGNPSGAAVLYDELLDRAPIEALEGKAAALALEGRFADALECHDRLIATGGQSATPERLIARSHILSRLGRYDEAIRDLDAALAQAGPSTGLLSERALCLRHAGRTEEARDAYMAALEADKDNPTLLGALGDVLLDLRHVSEAVGVFQKASRGNGGFTEVDWVTRGNRLLAADRAEDAIAMFESANRERSNADAWRGMGQAQLVLGEYEKSLEAARRAVELDPSDGSMWHLRASALTALKRPDEALQDLEVATRNEPKLAPAWTDMAKLLAGLGRFDEAVAAAHRAIELNGQSSAAWSGLGLYQYQLGDKESALKSWQQAFSLNPQSAWAANNISVVLSDSGRFTEALEWHDRALAIDETEATFWANKAETMANLGQDTDAAKILDEAARVVSSPASLLRSKVRLLAEYLTRPKEALQLLKSGTQSWPEDNYIAADYAELLLINGQYDAALTKATEVISRGTAPVTTRSMRFIILASHVLSHGTEGSDPYLQDFVDAHLAAVAHEGRSRGRVTYASLRSALGEKSLPPVAKLLLLTLIDVQEQRVVSSELSFFASNDATPMPVA